jgi:hypothetical protein
MAKVITLQDVNLSFNHTLTPQVDNNGKKSYGANFLFSPTHAAKAELDKAILEVATEKWGKKAEAELKALNAGNRVCLRDGNTKAYAGYEGNFFVSSTSAQRPGVYDRDGTPIIDESVGRPYPGCFVWATLEIWCQDNSYGKRVNAKLLRVQFSRDGQPFTGGTSIAQLGEVTALPAYDTADLV